MSSIKIKFKDGTQRSFPHEGRLGGNYTKEISYQNGFVVVKDEYGKCTSFPASDIVEIIELPNRF